MLPGAGRHDPAFVPIQAGGHADTDGTWRVAWVPAYAGMTLRRADVKM
jgi:hypothetical protein